MKQWVNLLTLKSESNDVITRRIIMAVEKNVAKALRSLEGAWEQSEPKSAGSGVDDGDYTCKLEGMKICLSKNKRLQVVSDFEIVDGKFEGETLMKFDGIDSDVSMSWFKGYCEVLGLEVPEDIGDLPDAIETYLGENEDVLFNLRVKTKGDYQNMYLQGVIDDDGNNELDPDDNDDDDDDDYDPEKEAAEEAAEEAEKARKKKAKAKKKKAKGRK